MNKIFVDKNLVIGDISENIYGSFIEHLGRAVYTGIYEPTHPTADKNGFRKDVINLVKELGTTLIRYPGGNFVSNYDWKDGIGKNRKRRLELAWKSIETNEFGTDEFIKWCKESGSIPMLAVNMGTGTPKDALEFYEYCNHPSGTYFSDLRRENGAELPHNVKYWCLGNEMDGPWQMCHTDAITYGNKVWQTAQLLRFVDNKDPSDPNAIQLIVCGSSAKDMPTCPKWDRQVLEITYDQINYISMHRYYEYHKNDTDAEVKFFSSPDDMNEFIDTIRSTIKYVKALKRSSHDVYISFDEWNVWKQTEMKYEPFWRIAPELAEDTYTFRDTLVFAGLMNTLINNCDIVKIACFAQLINVIAPITTAPNGDVFVQGIYHPFKIAANNAKGKALKAVVTCDTLSETSKTKSLNVTVTHNEKEHKICVFIINYGKKDAEVELELRSFGNLKNTKYLSLEGLDLDAYNDMNNKHVIEPKENTCIPVVKEVTKLKLSKYSYNYFEFKY